MKNKITHLLLVLLVIGSFTSCTTLTRVLFPNIKPTWLTVLPNDGKIYGIGYSVEHIKGPNFQRQVAMAGAVNQIASQKKVTVNNTLNMVQTMNGASATSVTVQTVDGVSISARTIDTWEDPYSKELHVLMVGN